MAPNLYVRALRTAVLSTVAFFLSIVAAAADGADFFAPDVAEKSIASIIVSVGKPFDAMGVQISPTELTIDLIPSDSATDAQSWRISHKGVIGGVLGLDHASRMTAGSAVSRSGSIADSRCPFRAENLAVVPKLAEQAIARARFDTPGHVAEMELRRLPAFVGPASKVAGWEIHVAAADEEAEFGANLDGKITSSDLSRTHRAQRLDLFSGGDDFDEFLARIRQETGKDWVFHRIEIGKKDIGLEMHIASDGKAQVQRFTASISEIQTSALDTPHVRFPGEPVDAPFEFIDVDFSQLLPIQKAALDKLAIPNGAVTRVTINRPQLENGASLEWTVDVETSDAPIFHMPGKPEPPKGSVTFDGKGAFLRAIYPEGDSRQANLFDAPQLKRAFTDIATQLGPHEPIVEFNVSGDSIHFRAADPKAPDKLVMYKYQNGIVTRPMNNNPDVAGMMGDGPDWRWDLALLTPVVLDRLPELVRRTLAANAKPDAKVVGFDFGKQRSFYPDNTEPLIEVRTEPNSDSENAIFDFSGEKAKALAAPAKSGLFVNGGASDDSDINGCEYSKDWPAVVAACTRWLDRHPRDDARGRAIEYFNRGNAQMNLKQWQLAIADYTKAVEVDPSYQRPYTNLGYSYLSSGDAAHAIVAESKAISFDPKKTFAYTVRAFAEEKQSKWDAALADFSVTIEQSNGDAQTYFNRGLAYYSGKADLDHAIADFSQAFAKDSTRADVLVYRGIARRLKGDLDGAIADHSEGLRVDPRNASAFFNRGMEYYLSGALPKALADLSQAAALAPNEPYLGLLLDIVATRSGVQSQLKDQSVKIDMGAWPAPAIRLLLQQLTPDALAAAAADGPPSDKPRRLCEATFYTGVALARTGKADAATDAWRQALATCPHPTPERSYAEVELKAAGAKP